MSYTIDEGVADTKREVEAYEEIAAVYPKAARRDGRWWNDTLLEVNHAEYIHHVDPSRARFDVGHALPKGGVVFSVWSGENRAAIILPAMRRANPGLFALVVAWLAGKLPAEP